MFFRRLASRIKSRIQIKILLAIIICIAILVIVLVSVSSYMLRSVFVQLYEEKLKAPGLILTSQYNYSDLLPYIEQMMALNNLAEESRIFYEDRAFVFEIDRTQAGGAKPDAYHEAKARMDAYTDRFADMKDDKYYEIYRYMLNLRVGTGLKYFRVIADLGVPDKYFYIFDATFQGDMGDYESGDLGMPSMRDNFPGASEAFRTGEPVLVLDANDGRQQSMYYYYYMPVKNDHGEVVAVIETLINMQSLGERLNYFMLLSVLLIMGISVAGLVMVYAVLRVLIIKPVRALTTISKDISEGDIYFKLPGWVDRRNDEMGTLGKSYGSMSVVLQDMISANESLFAAAMSGRLDVRSDPSKFKGRFAQLQSRINDMLDVISIYFDSNSGGLAILNTENDIVFTNNYFNHLFKGIDEKTIYQKVLDEPDDKDLDSLRNKMADTLKKGEIAALVWIEAEDGNKQCLSFIISQVVLDGKNNGALMVVIDSTELVLAKDNALAANKAKSEFLSRISHELRTPLNIILSMSKLGLTDEKIEDSKERFGKIVASSEHLSNIINDVLELSRMEAGKTEIRPGPVDLRKMIRECEELFAIKITEKNIYLKAVIDDKLPNTVVADEFRIKQILINLISNSIKFTETGGITLEVKGLDIMQDKLTVCFLVTDTGIGMSEEFLEKIFTPFEQEETFFQRKYVGTGLGLPISYNLAELMDGLLTVTSEIGKGSSFALTLTLDVADSEAIAVKERTFGEFESVSIEGKKILLADDIEINRTIVIEILADSGVIIDEAADGKETVEKYMESEEGHYDIVLMDIQMPEMNGYEAAAAIRESGRKDSGLPIIAMTANALKEDVDHAYECGMNGHIAKPIDFDNCINTIKKHCSEEKGN